MSNQSRSGVAHDLVLGSLCMSVAATAIALIAHKLSADTVFGTTDWGIVNETMVGLLIVFITVLALLTLIQLLSYRTPIPSVVRQGER